MTQLLTRVWKKRDGSRTLGHSSKETTKKIYTHPDFDILQDVMEKAWRA